MNDDSAGRPRFTWTLNWKICLFSLLLLPLLIGLGFWQLQRAEQKATLQELLIQQQDLPPLQWPAGESPAADETGNLYRRVIMQGQFNNQQTWLLENKILHGRVGYEALVPFYLKDGRAVLVNRGWLAGTGYRDQLPEVPKAVAESASGRLVKPSNNALLQQQLTAERWPQTALQVDLEQMQAILGVPLLPWVLQIEPQHPAALDAQWSNINMPASKHLGYAWQWFSMALALLILTIFANSNLGQVLSKRKN